MDNKTLIIVVGFILLNLPVIFAQTYKQYGSIDLKIPFEVNGSVPSSSAWCNVSIDYPNGSYLKENASMTNRGNGDFNITLNASKINQLGNYEWRAFCCDNSKCAGGYGNFEVTGTGFEFSQARSTYYLGLLALLVFFFAVTVYSIPKLPEKYDTDDYGLIIGINKLKYLKPLLFIIAWVLLLAILFTSSNVALAYLGSKMFGELLFTIWRIMFILTLPAVFIWLIFLFVQIFRDKEVKRMIERGIDIRSTQ